MHTTSKQIYAAVTVDIIGSTAMYESTGEPIRARLLTVLESINRRFEDYLAVPFGITLGDEFQGLVRDVRATPYIIYHIRAELIPLRCREGVGIGPVASGLVSSTRDMEGPAFSMSRNALDETKERKNRFTLYRMDDKLLQEAANAIAMLVDTIQGSWTEKQWQALRAYLEYGSWPRVAEALQITRQGVVRRIKPTHWQEVHEAISSLQLLLDDSFGTSS